MDRKYFRLTLPFPPSVNDYLGHRIIYKGKKPIVTMFKTNETLQFEKTSSAIIKNEIIKQKWEVPSKETWVRIECIWYLPKSGIDSNNLYKVTLDTLQANGVFINDSKVLEGCVNCYVDSKNPRAELNKYTLQKKGIFLGEDHLKEFKNSNCDECSKPDTCRVLKTALDNKITEDISLADNICFKKKTKK